MKAPYSPKNQFLTGVVKTKMAKVMWIQSAKIKIFGATGLLLFAVIMWLVMTMESPDNSAKQKTSSQWFESSSTGKLTQDMSYFAVSKRTSPVLEMNYPYNEITASIGFGCDKTGEWMYVAFSEPPNIANTETEEELHRFVTKISFDNQTEEFEATQKFGERFLHFRDDARLLRKLVVSKSMNFEVDWFREGSVRFKFPLAGSAGTIEKTRQKCEIK